jgi:hypothetical protein
VAALSPFAQGFKVSAGLAQFFVALWVLIRYPRTQVNVAFAVAFGANGAAFAIWNLARPGSRTPHTFALEGRGLLDWVAALALILFALLFRHMVQHQRRMRLLILPEIVAVAMLASDILKARAYHLDIMAFGGLAIYVTTAFVLALLALAFSAEPSETFRNRSALFSAALGINYADHIGASIVCPTMDAASHPTVQLGGIRWDAPTDAAIEVAGTLIILGLRVWNSRGSRIARITVWCMLVSLLAGVLVRIAAGNYSAVQESGFFGSGLIAATALLIFGMLARGLFSPQGERIDGTAPATGS